jgi:phosphoribosyl-dephospho-CoA transferase
MKRLPGETFDAYKKRRAEVNASTEEHLKGVLAKPMPTTPGIVKKAKKLERKFEKAVNAPLIRDRLAKTGLKVEEKLKELKKK